MIRVESLRWNRTRCRAQCLELERRGHAHKSYKIVLAALVFFRPVEASLLHKRDPDAVPANRQQTAPAVSRLPRVLTTRTKSGKPGAPREWPEEPQQASRARRLVTLPFAPIKKLGRSISNSKLASAFFFSGGSPRETQDAEARRTRTTSTDTIPEETSIISNVDASSQAQEPSPRLQRSRTGSGLLRKLSLKPIRVRRSSSLADKRL
ncbi:hypothetical protein WJX84_011507 [Apatococcus fuscideae]|uniref:Uncharacterized protein n=1 Tax=Apatococcus fuscideae TaxID=2026836 RepID=A0AAW1TBM9_9CHLO